LNLTGKITEIALTTILQVAASNRETNEVKTPPTPPRPKGQCVFQRRMSFALGNSGKTTVLY
jgi:hypothetical protein